VLLSHVDRQRFVEIFCEQFPPTAEGSFMLTVTGTVTIIDRAVRCDVTVCGDMRGTSEQRGGVGFDGSSVYCFDVSCYILWICEVYRRRPVENREIGCRM